FAPGKTGAAGTVCRGSAAPDRRVRKEPAPRLQLMTRSLSMKAALTPLVAAVSLLAHLTGLLAPARARPAQPDPRPAAPSRDKDLLHTGKFESAVSCAGCHTQPQGAYAADPRG